MPTAPLVGDVEVRVGAVLPPSPVMKLPVAMLRARPSVSSPVTNHVTGVFGANPGLGVFVSRVPSALHAVGVVSTDPKVP